MTVVSPVLVPAIIAGLFWLVSWRLWNRNSTSANGHWGGAIAFAGGYLAAYVLLKSWPKFPPASAEHWIVYAAVLTGLVAVAERWWGTTWIRRPTVLTLTFGLAWCELRALRLHEWSTTEAALWLGGLAILTTLVWDQLDRLANRRPGPTTPAALWAVTTGTAVACVLSKSAFIGQLNGALSAILGAAVVLACWGRKLPLHQGAITVFTLVFSGLLWQAIFFADLPKASALLLLLAPLGLWASEIGDPSTNSWTKKMTRTAAVLVPVIIAAGIAAYYFLLTPKNTYTY